MENISNYLNNPSANIIAVPHRKVDGEQGRQHIYRVCYVDMEFMTGLDQDSWVSHGTQYVQTNDHGVEFLLRPSMSWQIWWAIPETLVNAADEFIIG